MNPKTLEGKLLNGVMLADLTMTYVKAINEGAIPNIQSAWSYVCENECHKAKKLALTKYEATVKNLLNNKLPLPYE